jgi:Cdc6-like AAA superfamily ATPase
MCVIVLDELELACKQSKNFIKGLFTLTRLQDSKLVVVGIANRLDLAEELLNSGESTIPLTMVAFHSYNARQLLDLLKVRFQLTIL